MNSTHAIIFSFAAVAQLDRVLGYEPRGRGFDSCQPHQHYQGVTFKRRNPFCFAKPLGKKFGKKKSAVINSPPLSLPLPALYFCFDYRKSVLYF